jgi:hypothetical protein
MNNPGFSDYDELECEKTLFWVMVYPFSADLNISRLATGLHLSDWDSFRECVISTYDLDIKMSQDDREVCYYQQIFKNKYLANKVIDPHIRKAFSLIYGDKKT